MEEALRRFNSSAPAASFVARFESGDTYSESFALDSFGPRTLVLSLRNKPAATSITFCPFPGMTAVEIQRISTSRAAGKIISFPRFSTNAGYCEAGLYIFETEQPEVRIEMVNLDADELILDLDYLAWGRDVPALLALRRQETLDRTLENFEVLTETVKELQAEIASLKRQAEVSKQEQLALENRFQQIAETKQELHKKCLALEALAARKDSEIVALTQQIDEFNSMLSTSATPAGASRVATLRHQIHELRHQRDVTRLALERSREHVLHLEDVVKALAGSKSFQLTKPLRWFSGKLGS